MPWKEFKIMDQREHFAFDWLTGDYPKRALCAAYGISRPTGDKWLTRSLPGSRGAGGLGAAVQHRFGVQRPVTIHEHGRLFSRHPGDSFILSRGSAQDTMRFARIPFAD